MRSFTLACLIIPFHFLCSFAVETTVDTTSKNPPMVQDAVYKRPFITTVGGQTSIGGYAEANTNWISENGVSEGFSMEMRRFNLFVFSPVSSRIKVLAELEFEHGTEEISLETAQLDFEVSPALIARGGILLAPIGGFNQRHDSPLYEFVDRPLVATNIIPSTLSLMGFGAYGKFFLSENLILTYDAFMTNGLHDGIVLNDDARTSLQQGKSNELFEESNNGVPAVVGRLAMRLRDVGELGLSAYRGIYNSFRVEGLIVDERRSLVITAVDYSLNIAGIQLQGESAANFIDVHPSISDIYASRQWGTYLDVVVPLLHFEMMEYNSAIINLSLRGEYVDYNSGQHKFDASNIFDNESVIALGVGLRPTPSTVLRLNYRYHSIRDILGNPSTKEGIQIGFASYF